MDKFLNRIPTWKTKTYSQAMAAKKTEKDKSARKSMSQPLHQQQKQPLALTNIKETTSSTNHRRLTITSDDLLKILTEPLSDVPLIGETSGHDDDSGLSSSSSAEHFVGDEQGFTDENINPGICRKVNSSDLSDYVNGPQPKSTLKVSHTTTELPIPVDAVRTQEDIRHPKSPSRIAAAKVPPQQAASNATGPDCCFLTPKSNRKPNAMMSRIQRDLNSPSATVRIRAMKALRSPTRSAYSNFDVSHTEQDIITPQERQAPPTPISIEELMRNIVVYVEIRSGEDNRSAGVKKVISAMGARVNDKLLRNTTHVIFKDGRLSTYKRAKELDIPIVSILWIEACKNTRQICDPSKFPIANVDRYENPELYDKMKRVKSMQPDSELTKRIRVKPSTPKATTPSNSKKRSPKTTKPLKCDTPTTTNVKKTEITQFFKKAETPQQNKTDVASNEGNCDSPATQLLNRMTSNRNIPLKKQPVDSLEDQIEENDSTNSQDVDKAADFMTENVIEPQEPLDTVVVAQPSEPSVTMTDCEKLAEMVVATPETPENIVPPIAEEILAEIPMERAVPKRRLSMRRRSMLSEPISTVKTKIENTAETISEPSLSNSPQPARRRHSTQSEGNVSTEKQETAAVTPKTPKRGATRRRSMFAIRSNEIANAKETISSDKGFNAIAEEEDELANEQEYTVLSIAVQTPMDVAAVPSAVEPSKPRALSRRRSTYTAQPLEVSNLVADSSSANVEDGGRRLTTYTPQNVDETLVANNQLETVEKKTVAKVSSECALPSQSSQSVPLGKPSRTLFTPRRIEEHTLNGSGVGEVKSTISVTPQPQFGSLLEEHANMVTFNSARVPGKRRTLFDVSMDIISKRVETINQKRRQSLAPQPTPNDSLTPKNDGTISQPTTPLASTETMADEKTQNVTGGAGAGAQENVTATSDDTPEPKPKKRKLFTPNDSILLTPTTSAAAPGTPVSVARRRTLMPVMQPQSAGKLLATSKTSVMSPSKKSRRRSTMDFETARKVKPPPKVTPSNGAVSENRNNKLPTSKAKPLIVCTNMRREQIEVIQEALVTLGGFQLEHYVNNETTHVVSLEPRRTLNMLLALVRGLWILDFQWIVDSLRARRWLNEESYEMKDFSRAVEICRAERQAFGNSYKCELFSHMGSFYISHKCGPVKKDDLKELIVLCGGRVADNRKRAKYILGDINKKFEEKIYITPFWVLDSITQMQLLKFSQYHCFPEVPPTVQLVPRQPPQLRTPSELSSVPAVDAAKTAKR